MLDAYRVLDLTDERGQLAGMLLAQLGADVIAVEPADGVRTRHAGPFAGDISGPERSLLHLAYNRGKRSIRADASDHATLSALAGTADVVLDSGAIDGVDLDRLRADHPHLVTVSISAFGTTGPKAGWLASDLTVAAASGQMILTGDSDRPPVRISAPQAFHHAALEAAIGAVIALLARPAVGGGQHLDVSAQQSLMQATQTAMLASGMGAPDIERHAGGMRLGPYSIRLVYPAKDGFVGITYLFGEMIGAFTQRLMGWVYEEGFCSEEIRDLNYPAFFELIRTGALTAEKLTEATDALAALTVTKTKAELFEVARSKRLLIAPVSTARDLLANPHFDERGTWEHVNVPDVTDDVRASGPWVHTTGAPLLRPLGAAPTLGQHDHELDGILARRVVAPAAVTAPAPLPLPEGVARGPRRALDGLKILDFTWVIAGPMATRLLADHGATVVRIETEGRVDVIRAASPFLPGRGGIEDTGLWHSIAAGKHGIQVDLRTAEGRAVARDLALWADVVVEAFAPGFLAEIGLDFETLRVDRPDLVVASSSLMGQTGPLSDFAGFGNLAASIAGFTHITGWPDRPPAGPYTAYTDYVSPRFLALAIVTAVEHARRTGEGAYIDLSQSEAAIHFLTPALLDEQINGRTLGRLGTRDPFFVPHGVYPTGQPGTDQWIAVACTSDVQWVALAALLEREELRALSNAERHERADELDELISAWTSGQNSDELALILQSAGVAAHPVQRSAQCHADPQLVHRDHFRRVPHALHGEVLVEGPHVQYSATPPGPAWGGPTLGQHTMFVLEELVGYDPERIVELLVSDVLR
jgi:crotonobetainyl-CoA:carnitine CoA-transferase CaiB-like acyl-CoA transferase